MAWIVGLFTDRELEAVQDAGYETTIGAQNVGQLFFSHKHEESVEDDMTYAAVYVDVDATNFLPPFRTIN